MLVMLVSGENVYNVLEDTKSWLVSTPIHFMARIQSPTENGKPKYLVNESFRFA